MKFLHRHFLMLVAAALAWAAPAWTQATGTIVVTVVDDDSGQALETALVYIPALDLGGMSDAQGQFTMADVPVGEHKLRAELIGYSSVTATVAVEAGQTATVELRIKPSALLLKELTVTGTAFKESPINLPYAVAVTGRDKMAEQGSPQAVDFFKNLSASHGVIGERSSWYNANQAATLSESIANVNLRGLGASRTLVLINSRRQTYVPARLIGGRFVDVNAIPSIAVDRVEVLKEGASAIYGSDAVAGVANFLTRADFEGFEVSGAHEYIAGAGDSNIGAIWGGKIGAAHAVVSGEWRGRQALPASERDYLLQPWHGGGQRLGWSSLGNPGTFAVGAPAPWTAAIHAPRCEQFGGFRESWTCRFRYQQYENLIEDMSHTRAFAEINGELDNGTEYHLEGLFAQAEIPEWYTTPSYPPFPLTDTSIMEVAPNHPGREAFCADYGAEEGDLYYNECQDGENWYFNGRPFGNSGPGRILGRDSRTLRLAAAANGDLSQDIHFDLGLSYSRTEGNYNLPGVYIERLFLGFRGFGGPDCGVGVEADNTSLAGMRLGPLNGQVAGQGGCQYYNPFGNAIEFADQYGADFANQANPDYRANLANSPELRHWLNQEVDLQSTADLLVADATLSGTWIEDVASYAAGYQFRLLNASGNPNDEGDFTINPCPVVGDDGCSAEDRFGPYAFTNVNRPYDESQTVHRFFAEIPLSLGSRFDTQLAANYEFHDVASSFDPKFGWRYQLVESPTQSVFLRGSVQTTFRTPSLDDVNENPLSTLEWINETGAYQTVDRIGSKDLKPEQAFTYNAGFVLVTEEGFDATFDYWSYDFKDVIGAMPHGAITALYADEANKEALKQFIVCPDGVGTGTCAASELERVQVDIVNWPGVKTSGIDLHLGGNTAAGAGEIALSLDATYTLEYRTKALMFGNLELQEGADAAGYLNFGNPIATSLPKLKGQVSAGYHWEGYRLVSFLNYISSYEDRGSLNSGNAAVEEVFGTIDSFVTWDVSFLWDLSEGVNIALSGMNLLDTMPPLVNIEQAYDGFTHDPKGRRLKLALSYKFGG
ncbi:MAG: TonB-dependent receptor [Gemmatimonadetes bacterium]|nr:TonB-dependent receptor [Gemmatimonadota bacterium]